MLEPYSIYLSQGREIKASMVIDKQNTSELDVVIHD